MAADGHLLRFGVSIDHDARVFVLKFSKGRGEFFFVVFRCRFNGIEVDRLRHFYALVNNIVSLVAKGVAGFGDIQFRNGADVPGVDDVHGDLFLAPNNEGTGVLFVRILGTVEEGRVLGHGAAQHLVDGNFSDIGVGNGFKYDGREGFVVGNGVFFAGFVAEAGVGPFVVG